MTAWGPSAATVTMTHEGLRYHVEPTPDANGRGTVQEYWPGYGVVGSERAWLGDRLAARLSWYAAVNPSRMPGEATARVEGLRSRRAAVRWLLANTTPPVPPVEPAEGPVAEGGESR